MERDDVCEDAIADCFESGSADGQFVKVTPAEADCVTERGMLGLCFSLYLRDESEKVRLNAFVNDACDS